MVLVKVGEGGLEVVCRPAPKGRLGWFSPTADGAGLVLDSDLEIEDLELLAADHWPAWPVVVSLGESDGGTVLMNLEHAGSLSVEGDGRGGARRRLAAVLLQLVSQPWSQEMLAGLYSVGEPTLDEPAGGRAAGWAGQGHRPGRKAGRHRRCPGRNWPGTCRFRPCGPSPVRPFPMLSLLLPGRLTGAQPVPGRGGASRTQRRRTGRGRPHYRCAMAVGPWAPGPGRWKAMSKAARSRGS